MNNPALAQPCGSRARCHTSTTINDSDRGFRATSVAITLLLIGLMITQPATADVAFVANNGGDSIAVVDTATYTVLPNIILVGDGPTRLALTPDGQLVYATVAGLNQLAVISVANRSLADNVINPVPVSGEPWGIDIMCNGQWAYVSADLGGVGNGSVEVLDLSNHMFEPMITHESLTSPLGIAITPDDSGVYVANGPSDAGAGQVTVIETGNNSPLGAIAPSDAGTWDVTILPDGKKAYVSEGPSGSSVFVIDTDPANVGTYNTVIDTITIEDPNPPFLRSEPRGMESGMTPLGVRVFVAVKNTNEVLVIDPETDEFVARMGVGPGPWQPRLNADGSELWVSVPIRDEVWVFDTNTYVRKAMITRFSQPADIVFEGAEMQRCAEPPAPAPAVVLVIDEESIGKDKAPNFFFDYEVNEHKARLGQRKQLPVFAHNLNPPMNKITLYTGEVGDEGWFALKKIPKSWRKRGPTKYGLRNYVGVTNAKGKIKVGKGLGRGKNPESKLDKIRKVTPLRYSGLKLLVGRNVCAVVQKSDVSINYGPLNGSLKGDSLGRVAFKVLEVRPLTGESSSSLPAVDIEILDADEVCEGELTLFKDAPKPKSSSKPFDTGRGM